MGFFAFSTMIKNVQYLLQKFPSLKPPMRRSTVVITSATMVVALAATAVYLRRKRQKSFPAKKQINKTLHQNKRKRSGRQRYSLTPTTTLSPSSVRSSKKSHSRNSSCTPSLASSAGSISKLQAWKQLIEQDSPAIDEVEKLYQEGVDSFESAIAKWEKASSIMHITSSYLPAYPIEHTKDDETMDILGRSILSEKKIFSSKRIRRFSLNGPPSSSPATNHEKSDPLISARSRTKLKNRLHSQSESQLDELLNGVKLNDGLPRVSFEDQLQSIVQRAQHIQDAFTHVLYDDSGAESDTDVTLTGFDNQPVMTDTETESTESYVSARETWDTRSVDSHSKRQWMFEDAQVTVERGEVFCRTSRAELLNCTSEDIFLAKLHCLRQGFDVMLQDIAVRQWLVETSRSMIECILCVAERNVEDFRAAFARMIDYVNDSANAEEMEKELKKRKVVQINFYDIVLDFLLMDSFDDLASPPGPMLSIISNRWLANSLKESALHTAIWSVIKAKRKRLQYTHGFMSHMYDVSTVVTPVIAWGLMGPDGKLKDVCEYFKKVVMDFLKELFSFGQVRYTTPQQMADDILRLMRERFGALTQYLQQTSAYSDIIG